MATKTVLIAVPDKEVSALFSFVLAEVGHESSIVESLQEAVEALSDSPFDLIITEAFDQPSVFVFRSRFIELLRRAGPNTPIIVCSTCPSIRYLRPNSYGLAGIIPRPILGYQMLASVNRVLGEVEDSSQA